MDQKQTQEVNKEAENESLNRIAVCIPIAHQILAVLAQETQDTLPLGPITEADVKKYDEVALKVIKILLDHNLNYGDRQVVFQLTMQAVENLRDRVLTNLEKSFEIASEKLWKRDMLDITLTDVDNVLRTVESGDKMNVPSA